MELPQTPLKVLIYGQNRVGKTTLACQFPKPLLLVSFEPTESGGAESVRNVKGVSLLRCGVDFQGTDGALELARELTAGGHGYNTVVVDSATSLQEAALFELLGLEEMPVQLSFGLVSGDQYRARSEKTKTVLSHFLRLPLSVVVTAKEKDHNPPREERVGPTGKVQPDMRPRFLRGLQTSSYVAAELGGGATSWLQDHCDWICRLYLGEEIVEDTVTAAGRTVTQQRSTGRFIRYLRTGYHPNYAAGPRSSNPLGVPDEIADPTYVKFIKVVRGEV